jgi:transposase-like protein
MATDKIPPVDLSKLAKHFSDEDAARELLENWRWNGQPTCPHCGGLEPYKLTAKPDSKKPGRKGLYKCKACRKQFTVTVGTVFEDSRIPISKWLLGIHLISSSKKGMSAHQIHRMLGISYKAAWFMMHRLRYAMRSGPLAGLLTGTVEVDETYVGARLKRGSKRGRPDSESHKTPVVALVERGTGRVRAMTIPRITAESLWETIRTNMSTKATLVTDELAAYGGLVDKHETVKHSRGEYVRGTAHTNTVEGFFSLLKRGINGTFHHVSRGHLNRYCDEFAFRYENRRESDGHRAAMIVAGAEGKRLTYKQPAANS